MEMPVVIAVAYRKGQFLIESIRKRGESAIFNFELDDRPVDHHPEVFTKSVLRGLPRKTHSYQHTLSDDIIPVYYDYINKKFWFKGK